MGSNEERLRQIDERLSRLKRAVPDWRLYDGSNPKDPARQIWQLEEERKRISVKLANRGPVSTDSRSPLNTRLRTQTNDAGARRVSFTHSTDYRSVTRYGATFSLTPRQAQVIQILHEAYEGGNPDIGGAAILEQLGTQNSRLRDTFRSNLEAWKALVRPGRTKGSYKLNL